MLFLDGGGLTRGGTVDFRLLEEIAVFARHLNYSQAAKELYVSQPTLSQHIAKAESELGFGLFSHDGINRPTLAGQVFCAEIDGLLTAWNDLIERCTRIAAQEASHVRVLDLRMALRSLAFRDVHSDNLGVEYVPYDKVRASSEFDAVDCGAVDVSFAFAPIPDAAWFQKGGRVAHLDAYRLTPLAPEPCILRVPRSSVLSGRTAVTLDELEDFTFVYNDLLLYRTCDDAIREALAATGHQFKSVVGIGNAKASVLSLDPRYVGVYIETSINLVGQVLEPHLSSVAFEDFELILYPFAVVRGDSIGTAADRFVEAIVGGV